MTWRRCKGSQASELAIYVTIKLANPLCRLIIFRLLTASSIQLDPVLFNNVTPLLINMSVVQVIGAVSGLLSIFHFFQEQFHNAGDSSIGYSFKVGLDGAGGGLSNAGGNIPDIRAYNEHGELIGKKINDKTYCGPGDDNCLSQINKVHQQPTYTLFSGNNDAICIAWVSVTFPGQDKYAWIGNWGQQCGAAW